MNANANDNLTTANDNLAQFGGPRFIAMTGARDFIGDTDSLTFKLPRGAKDGINAVKVALDASDTYTVTFYKINRRSYDVATVSETSMVYADTLRATFTAATGLLTSL